MKTKLNIKRFIGLSLILLITSLFLLPDFAEARRGFGGGRSFGGSRSFRSSSRTSSPSRMSRTPRTQAAPSRTSFGGSRMSKQQATARYGTPRKVEQTVGKNAQGGAQTYNMNNYGGFSSGLMTGYMMGHTSMLWMMPFHPAFYYGRPHYVENPDGTIDVYPPTLSFGRIIMGLIILGIVIWIIRAIIRRVRGRSNLDSPTSSFS